MKTVVLVPVGTHIVPACENALISLEKQGIPVWRYFGYAAIDAVRNQMASDALGQGFDELIWIDSDIEFLPDDLNRLREHGRAFVCGLYAKKGFREIAASFLSVTSTITFGKGGGLIPILHSGFGFVYTRREVYEAIQQHYSLPTLNQEFGKPIVPYFAPFWIHNEAETFYLAEDYAFCERARQAGIELYADTRIRLWHIGSYRYGWEDAGSDKERFTTYKFRLTTKPSQKQPLLATISQNKSLEPVSILPSPSPLQQHAQPLPASFPRFQLYVLTYPANADSLALTLESIRVSDWGEEPIVVCQPTEWPQNIDSAARNYHRALEQASASGCDYAVILEDDVRVCKWLHHNLTTNPLITRDVCDYFSLFMPDLISSPWERTENHLGYRLAKPLYSGPNDRWEKFRIWGSQGYVLSRRFLLAAVKRWENLTSYQDTRVLSMCSGLKIPLWYASPCYIEHEPLRSAFGTPAVKAVDFDHGYRLTIGQGFQPPEGIPGSLTVHEGRTLFEMARGKVTLEIGTFCGRASVCLAQAAQRVLSIDPLPQLVALEWAKRYQVADRVKFCTSDVATALAKEPQDYEFAFINGEHDLDLLRQRIYAVLKVLRPKGLVAFHDYPDPDWPNIRRVVDDFAASCRWTRIAQADYLGVFQT